MTHQHQYLTTECLVLMVDVLMRKINQVTSAQKQEVGLVLPAQFTWITKKKKMSSKSTLQRISFFSIRVNKNYLSKN